LFTLPITDKAKMYKSKNGTYPIGYKIYYGDGSVYTASDLSLETWKNAPHDNVVLVMIHENTENGTGGNTRVSLTGGDYYFYNGDGFSFGHAKDTRVCQGHIIYGWWTTDLLYTDIVNRALGEQLLE